MANELILISYGPGHLPLELPKQAVATVIRKQQLAKLRDPIMAIADALFAPVASKPLAELAIGRRSTSILICDITPSTEPAVFAADDRDDDGGGDSPGGNLGACGNWSASSEPR